MAVLYIAIVNVALLSMAHGVDATSESLDGWYPGLSQDSGAFRMCWRPVFLLALIFHPG